MRPSGSENKSKVAITTAAKGVKLGFEFESNCFE